MELPDRLAGLNALINATNTLLLVTGWLLIRAGRREAHRRVMLTAFGLSALFLVSYLIRIGLSGTHTYPEGAPGRALYLPMLATHVILAIAVPVFAIRGIFLAVKGRLEEHRDLMKVGLPVWLYVAVTGVAVYLMLYNAMGRLPWQVG